MARRLFPHTRQIVDALHQAGASVGGHICGNTNNIIEAMVDTGVDLLSLDNLVDLEKGKQKVAPVSVWWGMSTPSR